MCINMELFSSRPESNGNRLDKEMRVYDMLDTLGVEYMRADHEPAETMEKCAEIEKLLGAEICKNLFLCNRQKTKFYLLMTTGKKPFKTKELSAQINSARLSFAEAEYMEKYLDILPGSVSVLGLMNDRDGCVTLLVDRDLLKDEFIGCHPCINTSTLKLRTSDILEKIVPHMQHNVTFVELFGTD